MTKLWQLAGLADLRLDEAAQIRNRLRDEKVWYSKAELQRIAWIVKETKCKNQSPQFLIVLAQRLTVYGFGEEALKLLDSARLRYKQCASLELCYALQPASEGDDQIFEHLATKNGYAVAQNNWGVLLLEQRKEEGALTQFEAALKTNPNYADANWNKGLALLQHSKFDEALAALSMGQELGLQKPGWNKTYAKAAVEKCQRYCKLFPNLNEYHTGALKPMQVLEKLDLAEMCNYQKKYATSVIFYEAAFQEMIPEEAISQGHYFNAACVAILLAKQEKVEKQKSKFRAKALHWLEEERALLTQKQKPEEKQAVLVRFESWRKNYVLASVRKDTNLPKEEQEAWGNFWEKVVQTLEKGP